jgi:hypothetical protein
MAARKLKVYYSYRSRAGRQPVPEVRLTGQWLEKSGFQIGDRVELTVKEGEIVIRREQDQMP